MIELIGITKTLKQNVVLNNISYTFEPGQIYGLTGRNGSGKTMLLRAISGLLKVSSGKILVDGKLLREEIDFVPNLGLLIENNNLVTDLSAVKNLTLLSKINKTASVADIESTLERVGLNSKDLRPVRKYSLGMKQRLAIAQAIFEKPDVILLDEPTNAIDESGLQMVRSILLEEKARGALIIIASHNKEDIEILADIVIQLSNGATIK